MLPDWLRIQKSMKWHPHQNQKCFKNVTNEEISAKSNEFKNANSLANEKKAVKNFTMFLEYNKHETNFFGFTEPELDQWLGKFCLDTRTEKGDYYSSGSLHTLHYGINRALKEYGHEFNITDKKCKSFMSSNKAFDLTLKEIKNAGKGHHKATPEISSVCKPTKILHKVIKQTVINNFHPICFAKVAQVMNFLNFKVNTFDGV